MPVEWLSEEMLTNGQDSPASQPSSPSQTLTLRAVDVEVKSEDDVKIPRNADVISNHVPYPKTGDTLERGGNPVKVNSSPRPNKDYTTSRYSNGLTNSNTAGQICNANIKALYSNMLSEGRDEKNNSLNNGIKNDRQQFSEKSSRFHMEPYKLLSNKTSDLDNTSPFVTDAWSGALTMVTKSNAKASVDADETCCSPSSRVHLGAGEPCHVCGEKASGNFFGALVCLPCKSFFIRCTKEGEPAFVSQCDGRCDVSKQGRNRCQHCRYEKCLAAGMSRKEKPETIEPGEGQLLCRVCGDIANGIHFGVYTCEGCKKFFRRGLLEYQSYVCKGDMSCVLNPRNRNNCRYCRYQKCINVGMSRGAIKMGRPKKLVREHECCPVPVSVVSQNNINESSESGGQQTKPVVTHLVHNNCPSSHSHSRSTTTQLSRHVSLSSESNSSFGEEGKSDVSDDTSSTESSRVFLPLKKCILRSLLTKEEAALLDAGGDTNTANSGHSNSSDGRQDGVLSDGLDTTGRSPHGHEGVFSVPSSRMTCSGDESSISKHCDHHDQRIDRHATYNLSTKDALLLPASHSFPSEKHFHKVYCHSLQRRKNNSPISNRFLSVHGVQEEHSKPKRRKSDNDSPGSPSSPLNHFASTFCYNNQMTPNASEQNVTQRKMTACVSSETSVFHCPSRNMCTVKPLDLSWPDVESVKMKQSQTNMLTNSLINFSSVTDSYHPRVPSHHATSNSFIGSSINLPRVSGCTESFTSDKRQNSFTVSQCQVSETSIHHVRPATSRFHHTHEHIEMDHTPQSVSTQSLTSGLVEVPPQGIMNERSPGDTWKNTTDNTQQDKSLLIKREVLDEIDNFFLNSFSLVNAIQQRLDKSHKHWHHMDVDLKTRSNVTHPITGPSTPRLSVGKACFEATSVETDSSRCNPGISPPLVLPEERHMAEKMESLYRFPPVHVCRYWNKLEPSQNVVQMSRDQHRVLQDMLEAYMEMLRNLGEGHIPPSESFSHIKTWPTDETAPIVEHVVRRILRQVKEELAFMCKVPGFNDFHPQDRIFIIHNICYANVTLMATRDWYNPETETFQNIMTWNLPEGHPMYRFRQKVKALAQQVLELKMDRTEAAMMSALNVAATDIIDLEEPSVIEKSRDFLISALTTHLSYKGVDPFPRMRQLFRLMPSFRLCGFWTKKLREEIALNSSGDSDKSVNVERLIQGNTHYQRDQKTREVWDGADA